MIHELYLFAFTLDIKTMKLYLLTQKPGYIVWMRGGKKNVFCQLKGFIVSKNMGMTINSEHNSWKGKLPGTCTLGGANQN
jgi:hypothetical protein